jgi:hypothetical protein
VNRMSCGAKTTRSRFSVIPGAAAARRRLHPGPSLLLGAAAPGTRRKASAVARSGLVTMRRRRISSAVRPRNQEHATSVLVTAFLGDALRSRVRRFESCWGRPVMSQDIEDTANLRQGCGVFFGQPDGRPVGW